MLLKNQSDGESAPGLIKAANAIAVYLYKRPIVCVSRTNLHEISANVVPSTLMKEAGILSEILSSSLIEQWQCVMNSSPRAVIPRQICIQNIHGSYL